MRFLHPEFLWLLSLLPMLAILRGRRSAAPALVFSSTSIASILAEGRKAGPGRILAALRLLGLGLLILAFARPQLGNTTTEIEASGIDILLAVDVSGSMGGLNVELDGAWANDCDANFSMKMGGLAVSIPRSVKIGKSADKPSMEIQSHEEATEPIIWLRTRAQYGDVDIVH